jgi:lipopolysaccharide/colanic/teichoic acid biosynthesis glycosyltransferase
MRQEETMVSAYFGRKALAIRILGGALLIIASPIIVLLVMIVRLTSAGPGLYRQTRTGRNGSEFNMLKIRTMYDGAESITGPVWSAPTDSRITPFGKFLRSFHLDELPQLVNVVRGEMDLVGPRPERPMFVARLTREIPNYRTRLLVLPGITGLAQVNLPPDETYDCVRRKLVLDRMYIRDASVFLDLRIMVCTALRLLGIRHGRAVRWLKLELSADAVPTMSQATGQNGVCHSSNAGHYSRPSFRESEQENGVPVAVLSGCGDSALAAEEEECGFASEATLPAPRPR